MCAKVRAWVYRLGRSTRENGGPRRPLVGPRVRWRAARSASSAGCCAGCARARRAHRVKPLLFHARVGGQGARTTRRPWLTHVSRPSWVARVVPGLLSPDRAVPTVSRRSGVPRPPARIILPGMARDPAVDPPSIRSPACAGLMAMAVLRSSPPVQARGCESLSGYASRVDLRLGGDFSLAAPQAHVCAVADHVV